MADEGRRYKTYDELVKELKDAGQSIIDNAESILGNERYFCDVGVNFVVKRLKDETPFIHIVREFIPEKQIEDEETYQELKLRKEQNNETR